jgi:ceramide glucosyltransferase
MVDVAGGADDDVLHVACYSVEVPALPLLALPLLPLVAGSLVYCVLTIVAAVRYRAVQPSAPREFPPISVLKPLAGVDEGLEQNLRTFFTQKYPRFEILFAVRSSEDPAIPVAERLRAEYPAIPSRLIVTGEPPYANAKVFSLDHMLAAARHDLLVMSDSDIRVTPNMLSTIAAEFADPRLGLATCPYRAVPGRSFWSTLEAVGLNTEFIGGVLVARMLDGMKFALGPTITARRETLERIGGFDAVKDYLAEDFVMGKLAAERGYGVILSSYVIEHRIGAQAFAANLKHRLRWNRSTRRSRPWGYIGQVFTNPLPLALLLWAASPAWWPLVAATAIFRAAAGWATAGHARRDPLARRLWWLVPLQDVASFVVWVAGFFGNTILWRGRRYYLLPDGRFELVR